MKTQVYIIFILCIFILSLNLSAQSTHDIFTYGYNGKSKMVEVYFSPSPKGKIYKKIYPDVNGGYIFKPIKILPDGWTNVIVNKVDCWIKDPMVYVYYGDSLVVNLFSNPSSKSRLLYKNLDENEPLIVIGLKLNWIYVKFKHKDIWYKGWIYKNNTDPSGV